MATLYTDSGSFGYVEVTGSVILSGSTGLELTVIGDVGITGSVSISGSSGVEFTVYGDTVITGSVKVTNGFTGSLLGTASYALASPGGSGQINVSANTTSNDISQLVFGNANNLTFGLNSNTVTVSYQMPIASYYENINSYALTSNVSSTFGVSTNLVQPFILPYDISVSYLRFLMTNSFASTTFATTANATYNLSQAETWFANIYTLGVGASSNVLQLYATASATAAILITAQVGAASDNQTVSYAVTFPVTGSYFNSSTNYNVNAASVQVSTTHLSRFNGNRFLDLPFATSLPAGAYWMAFQKSSARATTGGQLNAATNNNTFFMASQFASGFSSIGKASNVAADPIRIGLGIWTTNTSGRTTNSISIAQMSSATSNAVLPFQMIRQV